LHPVSSHRPPVITRDMANRRSNREPFKATSVCRLRKPRRGFRATGVPKCQLRQDQCRSWWPRAIDCERAGWARHLASVRRPKSPFRDVLRCEGRRFPSHLLINGSRSVHTEMRVTGVTFAEVLSSGR
jgi:hypothetical protein